MRVCQSIHARQRFLTEEEYQEQRRRTTQVETQALLAFLASGTLPPHEYCTLMHSCAYSHHAKSFALFFSVSTCKHSIMLRPLLYLLWIFMSVTTPTLLLHMHAYARARAHTHTHRTRAGSADRDKIRPQALSIISWLATAVGLQGTDCDMPTDPLCIVL